MNTKQYRKFLIKWLREKVKAAKAKGVVFGVSGGVDSAVVASIAIQAFPKDHLGIWMGIDSSVSFKRNALRLFEDLKLNHKILDLKPALDQFILDTQYDVVNLNNVHVFEKHMNNEKVDMKNVFEKSKNIKGIIGNIKARMRMITLYEYAQLNNYLVLGTSNAAEIYLGYFTKWGDSSSDLFPIANLTKRQVYALAKELNVNKRIIDAKPSADLYENQTDEEELGIKYNDIDDFLEGKKVSIKIKSKIEALHKKSLHKINPNMTKPSVDVKF